MTTQRKYVSLATAAEMLECSPRTLRRRISAGELPARRLGKGIRTPIRVALDDVEALLAIVPSA